LKPARKGSFEFDLIALMEANPATTAAAIGLSAQPFYDFLKVAFKRAQAISKLSRRTDIYALFTKESNHPHYRNRLPI